MSEARKKSCSILLRSGGKSVSLELFSAVLWPEECSRPDGLFRVRINDVWHCPAGKHSFLTRDAVGSLVAALLAGGELPEEAPAPYLPLNADVAVYREDFPDERGSVKVEPYQKRDGRWYCHVWMFGRGTHEICCDDVTLVRIRK